MNRAQPTVAKVYKTLDPGHAFEDVLGYQMSFRPLREDRWEAQVQKLPGMPFIGRTKEEATRNALVMAQKLAPKTEDSTTPKPSKKR